MTPSPSASSLWFAAGPNGALPCSVPATLPGGEAYDDLPLGIYEALRTHDHMRLFALEAHLDRAQLGMDLLGWQETLDRPRLRRTIHEALVASPWPEARVRIDVLERPAPILGTAERTIVSLTPLHLPPAEYLRLGTGSRLVRELRRDRPRIKRARFAVERRAFAPAGTREDYEPILVDERGRLLEGTSSNIFAVESGVLRTAEAGVLEGITRAVFLDIARGAGIAVREEAVSTSELPALHEAFLTSSIRGLVPIVHIDGVVIGDGHPGPVAALLTRRYAERVAREAAPPLLG